MAKAQKTIDKHANIDSEKLIKYYKDMLLLRRFEEKAGQLYGMGHIAGFCHLCIGQEAVAVGIQDVLSDKDSVITSYRDHGQMLACGIAPEKVMSELTGRYDGISKGKGGSMHMFSSEKNFYGGHGIVGAQVPLGTGLAFADKYKGENNVAIVYMGDGGANQGQVAEAFNMASLWQLPVIYVIENNRYAMGTSTKRHSAGGDNFHKRGEPYGIKGVVVDGMDILAVRDAAEQAVEHCKAGNGPYIMEMLTYRYRGHSMSDPATYRSKDEVNQMKTEQDPIDRVKSLLIEGGYANEETLKAYDKDIKANVQKAVDFSLESPLPDASELWSDILV